MRTTNADIIQVTKKDYQIYCKKCDWKITYLNDTYWRVERTMEMIAAMPFNKGVCEHSLEIKELS